MSLQAYALAICATGALIEALPQWVSVAMEPHEPVDLAEQRERMLVAVFIGDEHMDVQGRKWTLGVATVELVVQVVLPPMVKGVLDGVECTFDTRSGGTRPLYALVHEALRWAFTAPDAGSWGALLQRVFTAHPEPITGMPGKAERPSAPGKAPVPVIDYAIPCRVIMPPRLGESVPSPWTDIVAKMRADPAFTAPEADFFEALLAGRPLTPDRAELALLGLAQAQGEALDVVWPDGLESPPALLEVSIDGPVGPVMVRSDDGP